MSNSCSLFYSVTMVVIRTKSGRTKVKSIEFTDIKSNSTCLTINLPRDLCCDICRPKKNAAYCLLKKSSVGSKQFRDYKAKDGDACNPGQRNISMNFLQRQL